MNINQLFAYRKLNGSGVAKTERIAEAFTSLLSSLQVLCSEGREFSIVKTKLEEACFFAKKSVAVDPANQEGGTL